MGGRGEEEEGREEVRARWLKIEGNLFRFQGCYGWRKRRKEKEGDVSGTNKTDNGGLG